MLILPLIGTIVTILPSRGVRGSLPKPQHRSLGRIFPKSVSALQICLSCCVSDQCKSALNAQSLRPPVLLFVDSKERAKELHRELAFEDIKVDSIHADRTQEQRDSAVEKFREGKTWVLIATDLMARGMDFKGVNCVINYDFPQSIATYIHRVGRSGRAGRSGEAVTFYTEKDVPSLRSIAHVIRGAGCEVPEWMLALRKVKPKKRKIK